MSEPRILEGAEPFFFEGNEIGVLVSHGFTGSTQSMREYGKALHAAGFTVSGPRLAGHGISPVAMAQTTAGDWIHSLEDAFETLSARCSKVFVTGLSMGGTLTLYMAGKYAERISGIVTVNATIAVGREEMGMIAFDRHAPEFVPGIGSDIKKPGVTELAYSEVPVAAIRQIYSLVGATRGLLSRVSCPALVIQSREDHIVEPQNGPNIVSALAKSPSVELQWLENSYHVATLDNDKEFISARAVDFIRRNAA